MHIVTCFSYFTTHRAALHVHCHLVFMFYYTQLYFMHTVTSFLCFTTVKHEKGVTAFLKYSSVVKHKKEVTMYMKYNCIVCVVKHKKEVTMCHLCFMFHYTELYCMYIVTSFLCFTTHSCTSYTLSPLFYVSLHRAVLHVHCHLCSEI
jgi:hypothetical protein